MQLMRVSVKQKRFQFVLESVQRGVRRPQIVWQTVCWALNYLNLHLTWIWLSRYKFCRFFVFWLISASSRVRLKLHTLDTVHTASFRYLLCLVLSALHCHTTLHSAHPGHLQLDVISVLTGLWITGINEPYCSVSSAFTCCWYHSLASAITTCSHRYIIQCDRLLAQKLHFSACCSSLNWMYVTNWNSFYYWMPLHNFLAHMVELIITIFLFFFWLCALLTQTVRRCVCVSVC